MKTIRLSLGEVEISEPCVATLGFFDGVHRGHQFLISQVIDEAKAMGLASAVVTFDKHPRQVLRQDYQPELLTTLEDKLRHFERLGIDVVFVLTFDERLSKLTAREFMSSILKDQVNVRKFIIGYDNHFGHNRREGFEDYRRYGDEIGMEVAHGAPFSMEGIEISSSVIRALIKGGEVELANQCLGYTYTISGKVVNGFKQGRKLGYPTANLDTASSGQLLPQGGVYATRASIDGLCEDMPAMSDIGNRPTFGGNQQTVETFIFDFCEDLYDKPMRLSFLKKIREDRKFDNVTLLVEQLKEDERVISEYFNRTPANE